METHNLGSNRCVGLRFQVLFHSPPGVLFTFPSRYLCTIGQQVVFSLILWSGQIPTGFHVPRGTREISPGSPILFAYGAITLYGWPFQAILLRIRFVTSRLSCITARLTPTTPHRQRMQPLTPMRFRLFPVRSPLLRESHSVSFPQGTEMFHFPWFASLPYVFRQGYLPITAGGFPHSGIPGS